MVAHTPTSSKNIPMLTISKYFLLIRLYVRKECLGAGPLIAALSHMVTIFIYSLVFCSDITCFLALYLNSAHMREPLHLSVFRMQKSSYRALSWSHDAWALIAFLSAILVLGNMLLVLLIRETRGTSIFLQMLVMC